MKKLVVSLVMLLGLSCGVAFAQTPSSDFNAGKHTNKGLPCEACHGKNMAVEEPTIKQCSTCHDPKQLAQKTSSTDLSKHNPHQSPHYGTELECTNCHHGHEEPENFCSQCHNFKFNVK